MKRLMTLFCCCCLAISSFGQQALGQRPRVSSPVVNADGTVTFNFYDPSAQQVSVRGDFEEIRSQNLPMTKQENGVWTVTTGPLAPELYSYSLSVDGQRFIDPANSYVNRDISTLSNIFIVSKGTDDKGHLYQRRQGASLSGEQCSTWNPFPCVVRQSDTWPAASYDRLSAAYIRWQEALPRDVSAARTWR